AWTASRLKMSCEVKPRSDSDGPETPLSTQVPKCEKPAESAGFSQETRSGGRGIRTLEHFRVAGFQDRTTTPVKHAGPSTSEDTENVLAHCLALLTPKYSDLALLVKRWHALPQMVRAGIVAMVRAVQLESNG